MQPGFWLSRGKCSKGANKNGLYILVAKKFDEAFDTGSFRVNILFIDCDLCKW